MAIPPKGMILHGQFTLRGKGKHRIPVDQHGHPARGKPLELGAALGAIRRWLTGRPLTFGAKGADPVGQPQQPAQVFVHS